MNKSETTSNLATALIKAMQKVSYLQKDKDVGSGSNSYKGLTDEKVTKAVREALIEVGIICIQSSIEEFTDTERWAETNNYGTTKAKIHVFTRVKTTFTLIHAESGESMQVQAIGHGIDNGDKAAGKAMTYAKKNALLNSLLISTGLDSDDTHNEDLPKPPAQEAKAEKKPMTREQGAELLKQHITIDLGDKLESVCFLLTSNKVKDRQKIVDKINSGANIDEVITYLNKFQ